MPPLYYLDPSREPRDCPCKGICPDSHHETDCPAMCGACIVECERCPMCNGTGRLGEEGAEPDVEVYPFNGSYRFRTWRTINGQRIGREDSLISGIQYPTEAEALAAARAAAKERR